MITILASALILAAFPASAPEVQAAAPKVVIIVGPVGSRTDSYRADGNAAARAARAAGATVEKIYSPDATWPRVRDALQGASLVVYLGHGNGWPSKYRDSPFPKTQNGMGLNPEAGGGDDTHQYFGEKYIARDVRLAPHAVVLLLHLCYASGNSEPGLPEGGLATGQQRVDNYAAGWLAAGAEAVLAEGLGGPGYYVGRILAGDGTIETIWRKAPTAHGNVLAFPSARTPGMTGLMDPTHRTSGFYRSLVGRIEMRADEVARGAAAVTPRSAPGRAVPAAALGPAIKGTALKGVPTAGSSIRVTLTLAKGAGTPADSLGVGVRWSPLSLDPPMADETADASPPPAASPKPSPKEENPSPARAAAAEPADGFQVSPRNREAPPLAQPTASLDAAPSSPAAATSPVGGSAPDGTVSPSPSVEPAGPPDAPPVVLISPEIPGNLVNVTDVKVKGSKITADVAVPAEPGLYRLAVTVHDSDGVAFDASTQERIPAFTVRVTGELSAVVSAADRLTVVAGDAIELPVTVANTGKVTWVADPSKNPVDSNATRPERDELYATLVGRWMRLDGSDVAPEALAARATINPPPGATQDAVLSLAAPADAGTYLLVLDVVSPLHGSLMAAGSSPKIVRVEVTPPASEEPGSDSQTEPEARRTRA